MQPDAQFKKVIRLISEDNLAQAEAVCLELLSSDPADINLSALLEPRGRLIIVNP